MNKILVLFLSLVVVAGMGIGTSVAQDNVTIGDNASLLSPSQNQTQDQAQAQAQTSNNTNNNNLTNNNTINITNINTFDPNIIINLQNTIGAITVSSLNLNSQEQCVAVPFFCKNAFFCGGTSGFVPGGVPAVMGAVPTTSAAGVSPTAGMQEAGLNVTSLLMGIVGVLGGLVASRFSS